MDGPVPDRRADDEGNGKVNQGLGPYATGLSPVQARVRYENPHAADKQPEDAQHCQPVREANNQEATWSLSGLVYERANAALRRATHAAISAARFDGHRVARVVI